MNKTKSNQEDVAPIKTRVKDWEYIYDNNICERLLNEDNPQYVLGWNACRYLSKDFIQKLNF